MPISGSWGYKKSDTDFKSIETLIRNLVDIASKGGNYLLNVSPTGQGTLLPQATERLKAMGQWMKVNSESIYGTTASPFGKLEWGRCTKKEYARGTTLYLHVFDWPEDGKLHVPGLQSKVVNAYLMADWKPLETQQDDSGVVVSLPAKAPDDIVSVVVVKVSGALEIGSATSMPQKYGSLVLSAESAYIHNNEGSRNADIREGEGRSHIGYWTDDQAWVEWSVKVDQPGTYEVWGELAVESEKTRFLVGLPDQQQSVEVLSTGGYGNYVNKSLCEISFDKAGTYSLRVTPEKGVWQPINLRQLELKLK
jgi:alpha-L-fucosidase